MSTITGELGREELERIMRENAGWRFDPTLQKVETYITAGEALLTLPLSEFERSGERARLEPRIIREQVDAAIRWYEQRRRLAARPSVTYADMRNFQEN